MRGVRTHVGFSCIAALASVALFAGCAGSMTGTPGTSLAAQAASDAVRGATTNVFAGQYTGTANFGTLHNGKATASLVQSQGAVGGMLTATFGKTKYVHSLASNATGNSLSGIDVATVSGNACSFSLSASYDQKTHKLSVSFTPVNRCSGETGGFSLTKQCFYKENGNFIEGTEGAPAIIEHPANGLHGC